MQKRTLGDMQLHLAVFYSLLSFIVLKRVISESLREYSAHPFLALTCRLLSSSFFHTSLCPSPFYFLGSVLYGSGWVKACVYSRKFAAPIDPWAILLRALDSQGSPLVIGKSLLDQNTSRRASLSHSFSSLLRFRIRLDSVPVLLTDWPRARFRSDLEGLIPGSALFHLFHSIWKGLSRYTTSSNCFFFLLSVSQLSFWQSLFLSHPLEAPSILRREPDGYFKDVWETYWIFLQEKWLITDE